MATNCVTPQQKKSAEYIAAMDKFNISSGELEMILHEYQNLPENAELFQEGKLSFPPNSYLEKALYGEETIISDPKVLEIYEKVFSKPFITSDITQAMQAANEAAKYFENKSIKIRETKDGQYQVLVTPPVLLEPSGTIIEAFSDDIFYQYSLQIENLLEILRKEVWAEISGKVEIGKHGYTRKQNNKYFITVGRNNRDSLHTVVNNFKVGMQYLGIPESVFDIFQDEKRGRVEISLKKDEIEKDSPKDTSTYGKKLDVERSISQIYAFLKERIPTLGGLHFIRTAEEAINQYNINPKGASFIKDGEVYIITERVTPQIAVEECLHPLVNYIQEGNTKLFNDLLEEAKKLFPTLYAEIEFNYSNKNGFNLKTRQNELVTQALSRYFAKEFEENTSNNIQTFQHVVNSLLQYLADFFNTIIRKSNHIKADEIPTLKLKELAKLLNTSDSTWLVKINKGIQYNIQNTNISEQFFDKQSVLKSQLDQVYGLDSQFTGEEFRQIAADVIYEISDIITEVEKNPEAILKYNSNANVDNVLGSSRASILSQIGVANILDYIKRNNFSPFNGTTGNPNITGRKDAKKAKIISDNINAFLTQGASLLLQLEGFGITDNLTINEDVDTQVNEDLNNDNEKETIQETVGSLQEHWQIESRTENAFDKASVLVKQALTQCYKLNPDGTPVVSRWGVKQRMDGREAMQSVIRWTQGALTLSSMVKKLEAQSKKNPWVLPIIERLKDTSGNDSTFQSQFFGTVSKYFQLYSVGKKENGEYSVFEVNTHPALSDAKKSISGLYNAGAHPLFDSNGKVNETSYEQLKNIWESLEKQTLTPENTESIAESLSNVSRLLGYPISKEALMEVLDAKTYQQMTKRSLQFIVKNLEENKNNASWQPFSGKKEDNGIINNIGKFITPITDLLEDVTNTSFYDSGNTYQSYVTPSYLTKLVQKFTNLSKEEFDQFVQDEFGKFEQFKQGATWRNSWLELFENNPTAREVFAHKVQLNFAGNRYMQNRGGSKAMSEAELTLSILAEYFREEGYKTTKELAPAWFRVPLMSNKPSSEFMRFFSYRGPNYRERVLKGCMQLFSQELSRIQTVKKRNEVYSKEDPEWIENFDEKGSKFCFFDFLNDVEDKRFHELVEAVTTYTQKEGSDNSQLESLTTELTILAKKLIKEQIENEFKKQLEQWESNGVVKAASQIKSISEKDVTAALENFFWNDFLASNNILNLTITDLAYYKNTEDVQKRLAQLHAPGIRPNLEATDFKGNKVADSKTRTLYLKDVEIDGEKIKSNIIANVKAVFDKKLATMDKNSQQYKVAKATYESIIEQFETGINIADAQGYACPTSYRKKALLFGKWDKHSEEIYQKLIKGDYTFTDLKTAFQPLKPFVYTQIEHDTGVENGGLPSVKMGVQNKNSEYLLIMANAITQNEDTGMPNYLRAIYQVMEDSHKGIIDEKGGHIPRVDGIDTVQFESTVKTGKTGLIDITEAESTDEAIELLESAMYEDKDNHQYNTTYVQELNFEDYCIQQEVPEHFKDHEQQQGSQIRMIIPSDLNPSMKYNVEGRELSAKEFRDEYEKTISENIEESIKELEDEFGINPENLKTKKEQNISLAKTLQKEILSSPRYGLDLLMACLLDEQGNFNIPLGDSIQSKRIEQLLNSIIKNRVNKQKIAGGPVVQVTNFGTSRQLNIRFKGKNKEVLKTLAQYLEEGRTEQEWVDYIKDNQVGVAHYECFAPAYMQSIFEQFMDAKGNIDVEAMEKTNPDLLKMIGYRIPSEDKYSLAPIKIVGFMPKEAGDGIMLPYEITLITGSDRDVIVSTSII